MKVEKNKFKRAWIWVWYNDVTRFCVLIGLPVIPVTLLVSFIFGQGQYLSTVAISTYLFLLVWAVIDNDYTNLRRINMTEYRRKIENK